LVDQKFLIQYTVIVAVRKEQKMAEVRLSGLYKVTITEYERGWGQRADPNDTKFFTTREEAEKYALHWEKDGNPDYYFRASIERVN
jgi:hypothetical protein